MKDNSRNIGVLVLSDMHMSDPLYGRGAGLSKFDEDITFKNRLFESVQSEMAKKNIELKYVLVLGDCSDFALSSEFDKAKKILDDLCDKFSIDKCNVLIIPGNHDISREKFRFKCYDLKIKKEEFVNHQDYKFEDFTKFYNNFYNTPGIEFNPNKAVTRVLCAEEMRTVFIGINSIYRDSFLEEDHCGYINYLALENEMPEIYRQYSDYKKIAIMHHVPQSLADDKGTIKNWNDIKDLLGTYNVTTFFSGHAHTTDGKTEVTSKEIDYLTSGSLSAHGNSIRSSYVLLEFEASNYILKINTYNYEGDYNPSNRYWQNQTEKQNIMNYIKIR